MGWAHEPYRAGESSPPPAYGCWWDLPSVARILVAGVQQLRLCRILEAIGQQGGGGAGPELGAADDHDAPAAVEGPGRIQGLCHGG